MVSVFTNVRHRSVAIYEYHGTVLSLPYSQLMSTVDTLEKTFVSIKYWTIIYHLNAVFKPAIRIVNWLFLSCSILSQKVKRIFLVRAQPTPQTLPHWGRDTPPQSLPPRRLDTRDSGARPVSPFQNPGSTPGLRVSWSNVTVVDIIGMSVAVLVGLTTGLSVGLVLLTVFAAARTRLVCYVYLSQGH